MDFFPFLLFFHSFYKKFAHVSLVAVLGFIFENLCDSVLIRAQPFFGRTLFL